MQNCDSDQLELSLSYFSDFLFIFYFFGGGGDLPNIGIVIDLSDQLVLLAGVSFFFLSRKQMKFFTNANCDGIFPTYLHLAWLFPISSTARLMTGG